ncbi:hypothetical protein BJ742DRAFT_380096 [Cladochytrium replicatum]|nr:hypothetical protein BJ742DRAFT_380096 [Cladochytrium replicatum]
MMDPSEASSHAPSDPVAIPHTDSSDSLRESASYRRRTSSQSSNDTTTTTNTPSSPRPLRRKESIPNLAGTHSPSSLSLNSSHSDERPGLPVPPGSSSLALPTSPTPTGGSRFTKAIHEGNTWWMTNAEGESSSTDQTLRRRESDDSSLHRPYGNLRAEVSENGISISPRPLNVKSPASRPPSLAVRTSSQNMLSSSMSSFAAVRGDSPLGSEMSFVPGVPDFIPIVRAEHTIASGATGSGLVEIRVGDTTSPSASTAPGGESIILSSSMFIMRGSGTKNLPSALPDVVAPRSSLDLDGGIGPTDSEESTALFRSTNHTAELLGLDHETTYYAYEAKGQSRVARPASILETEGDDGGSVVEHSILDEDEDGDNFPDGDSKPVKRRSSALSWKEAYDNEEEDEAGNEFHLFPHHQMPRPPTPPMTPPVGVAEEDRHNLTQLTITRPRQASDVDTNSTLSTSTVSYIGSSALATALDSTDTLNYSSNSLDSDLPSKFTGHKMEDLPREDEFPAYEGIAQVAVEKKLQGSTKSVDIPEASEAGYPFRRIPSSQHTQIQSPQPKRATSRKVRSRSRAPIPEKKISNLRGSRKVPQDIVLSFETWENHRWWVGVGWTAKMMPSDRPPWSDIQGVTSTPKQSFHLLPFRPEQLPKEVLKASGVDTDKKRYAWMWDSPWYVDTVPTTTVSTDSESESVAGSSRPNGDDTDSQAEKRRRRQSKSPGPMSPTTPPPGGSGNRRASTPNRQRNRSNSPSSVTSSVGGTSSSKPAIYYHRASDGASTDPDGWEYADSNWRDWRHKKSLKRIVRRRRWVRHARLFEIGLRKGVWFSGVDHVLEIRYDESSEEEESEGDFFEEDDDIDMSGAERQKRRRRRRRRNVEKDGSEDEDSEDDYVIEEVVDKDGHVVQRRRQRVVGSRRRRDVELTVAGGKIMAAGVIVSGALNIDEKENPDWTSGVLEPVVDETRLTDLHELGSAADDDELGSDVEGLPEDEEDRATRKEATPTAQARPQPVVPAATPVGTPPVGAPPVGSPPVGAPPVGTHPVGAPPVGTHPVGAPPVGTPPVGSPPIAAPLTPQSPPRSSKSSGGGGGLFSGMLNRKTSTSTPAGSTSPRNKPVAIPLSFQPSALQESGFAPEYLSKDGDEMLVPSTTTPSVSPPSWTSKLIGSLRTRTSGTLPTLEEGVQSQSSSSRLPASPPSNLTIIEEPPKEKERRSRPRRHASEGEVKDQHPQLNEDGTPVRKKKSGKSRRPSVNEKDRIGVRMDGVTAPAVGSLGLMRHM